MGMIVKVAWRNLWRHKRRTLITISAITFAVGLVIFFLALGEGVYHQMISDAVRVHGGHFTLEHPEYQDAPAVDLALSDSESLRNLLEGFPEVEGTKALILGQGVVSSSSGAVGVSVMGVEPDVERATSPLARRVLKGAYLDGADPRGVVVGVGLAERLGVDVGRKMVLTANTADGQLVEELLRVGGIFRTGSSEADGYLVQLPIGFAREIYGLRKDQVTQLGAILRDEGERNRLVSEVRQATDFSRVKVLPWEDVLVDLAAYVRMDRTSNRIFQSLFIFVSLFTIFNTILMSILERRREFAVLLALGTRPSLLRAMVLGESVFLSFLGCAGGMILGAGLSYWMQIYGIDLSHLVRGEISVSGFAIDPTMRARATPGLIFTVGGLVFVITVLMTLVPLRHVKKISPAEVLR